MHYHPSPSDLVFIETSQKRFGRKEPFSIPPSVIWRCQSPSLRAWFPFGPLLISPFFPQPARFCAFFGLELCNDFFCGIAKTCLNCPLKPNLRISSGSWPLDNLYLAGPKLILFHPPWLILSFFSQCLPYNNCFRSRKSPCLSHTTH